MSTSTNKVALVTGASDGIGAEFVKILAGRGYDLILVARRKEKLDQLAVKLSDEFGVNCTVIAADLSEPKAAQNLFQRVEDSGLQVNFLINNSGLIHNGFFTKLSLEAQEKMMRNLESCGLKEFEVNKDFSNKDPNQEQYAYSRYALFDGYMTGSKDGKPLAPLLGDIKEFNQGCSDFNIGPVSYFLAYCDHIAVSYTHLTLPTKRIV